MVHPSVRANFRHGQPVLSSPICQSALGAALLWYFFHGAYFGSMEMVLGVGIVAAFAAAGVLGAFVGSARRKLAGADAGEEARLRAQMARGQRIASLLLVVTVVCMAIARMI